MMAIREVAMMGASGSDLLGTIRDLAREYEVFGELGRRDDGEIWFLARAETSEALLALRLRRCGVDEWGDPRYEFEVARTLGSDSPAAATHCSACGSKLRTFARFCSQCGADQSLGLRTGRSPGERRAQLADVRAATADRYDVLGEMSPADGGGDLYFALQRSSGALVRLRLRNHGAGVEVTETHVGVALEPARPTRLPLPVAGRPSATVPQTPAPVGRRERMLIYAAAGLGLVVLFEVTLLLVR